MNCFYHPTIVAVGVCKSCGKGLCPHCAVDLGKGLACKGRCEKDVAEVIGLIERNIKISPVSEQMIRAARGNRYFTVIFYVAFGLVFLGFATFQAFQNGFHSEDSILWGMGSVFLILGLVMLYRAIRFSRPTE